MKFRIQTQDDDSYHTLSLALARARSVTSLHGNKNRGVEIAHHIPHTDTRFPSNRPTARDASSI